MILDISTILRTPGAALDFSFEEQLPDLEDAHDEVRFTGPVTFKGSIRHTGKESRLQLTGELSAEIHAQCTRCLASIIRRIQVPVDVIFSEDGDDYFDAEEVESSGDLPADYRLTAPMLELNSVARDALLLAIPMRMLCTEDCKGTCPICGANHNEDTCSCDAVENGAGSPFDILKKLL